MPSLVQSLVQPHPSSVPQSRPQLHPTRPTRNQIRVSVPSGYTPTPYVVNDPWNLDSDNDDAMKSSTSSSNRPSRSPAPPLIIVASNSSSSLSSLYSERKRASSPLPQQQQQQQEPTRSRKKTVDSSPVFTETQKEAWLDSSSADPYVLLPTHIIQHLNASLNVWIKYENTRTRRFLPGGVLIKNGYPNYVYLRNPHTNAGFSVQLEYANLYTRKNVLSHIFPLL